MNHSYSPSEFPFPLLGGAYTDRPKIIYFEHLVEKVRKAVEGWKARVLSFGGRITLIKYVLLSFPIYTLASSTAPQTVIRRINTLMAQFLWNVRGEGRTHWVSWDEVCTPTESGGLGIRSIATIREALHAKSVRFILHGNSLWARYATSKFFKNNAPVVTASDSPIWRRLVGHYPYLLSMTKWLIGKGNIGFWTENWAGEILGGPLPCDIGLTVAQGLQVREDLLEYIPSHLHGVVREPRTDSRKEDRLIFTLLESGNFSTKEYIKYTREPANARMWPHRIWNPSILPNVASFLWKLLRHAIPVDCRVRSPGIQIASRCRRCLNPQEETLLHLFVKSEVAYEVWRCFGLIYKLPYSFNSILQAIKTWMNVPTAASQFDIARMATAAHLLHEIWVGRCRATYDDKRMRARQICIRVIRKVQTISLVHKPNRLSTKIQYNQLELVGITRKHIRFKPGGWFRWDAPGAGTYKINIDRPVKDNVITCGGVIRDAAGYVVVGFSINYGQGTNNRAELLALRDGVDLCVRLQLERVCIESDSTLVVQAIQRRHSPNWRLHYLVN